MDNQLFRLKRRAQILGNHYRKYLHIIDKQYDGFVERLERKQLGDAIHIWETPFDYRVEMAMVAELGRSPDEKLADLGCYFALQFLQQNLNALDALRLEVSRRESHFEVYREFMLHVGHQIRQLVAGYMTELLKLFLPATYRGEFVFLGVGTRSDQDDIDIGVVDSGAEGREHLTAAIARLNAEMLRKAITTHYHLSEHVCVEASFSASIEEYQALLNSEIHDFVIINEMLGAARILGNRRLFSAFHRNVAMRYYYQPQKNGSQKFHEGYLRGIIGETRSFMFKEFADDRIDPKVDGLRMIKAGLFAAKSIFGLRQVNAWALLQSLKHHDKKRAISYHKLEVCLTYLEVMRFLYHLLVSQEEEIYINDPATRSNLALVADFMGYQNMGSASALDFFIADYYNKARLGKATVQTFMPSVIQHLASITTFGRLLYHRKVTGPGEYRLGNLAQRFLEEAKFFRGTRYWDDIIAVLGHEDRMVMDRLVADLDRESRRDPSLLSRYLDWGWNSFITLCSFMNLLHRYEAQRDLHRQMMVLFFQRPLGTEEVQRFCIVFDHTPQELHQFIATMTEAQQRQFQQLIRRALWDQRVVPARERLDYVVTLHYGTSHYLRRVMNKVLKAHPAVYRFLNDPDKLQSYGKGLLAEINQTLGYRDRVDRLILYHDFEFFRVCLLLLGSTPALVISDEFAVFSDLFLSLLYDTCKNRILEEKPCHKALQSPLTILVTGGYGHMLAFDDDHDMIILLDSEDEEVHAHYTQIINRMHRAVARSGIMPHYRLADHFGSFLTTPAQLRTLTLEGNPERFIDMSQLLGARMVVGTHANWRAFQEEFIEGQVFGRKKEYASAMVHEIRNRHLREQPGQLNLKEIRGGLRDVEMLLDIFRALFEIQENSNYRLFKKLEAILPRWAETLQALYRHYEYLRMIRNLNRLAVAADDDIEVYYLHSITATWRAGVTRHESAEALLAHIQETLGTGTALMERLIDGVVTERLQ